MLYRDMEQNNAVMHGTLLYHFNLRSWLDFIFNLTIHIEFILLKYYFIFNLTIHIEFVKVNH